MKKKNLLLGLTATCAIAICALTSCKGETKNEAESYVTMDLNPSVSFVLDSNNKVLSASGDNEEGDVVLYGENVVGLDINAAIKVVVEAEKETGFVVSGSVKSDENNFTFTVTCEDNGLKKELENKITSNMETVCKELDIKLGKAVEFANSKTKAELVKMAKACDPSYSEDELNKMTYEQLLSIISLYQIETAELYGEQLEALYNQVKTYEIAIAEQQFTKDAIAEMGAAYNLLLVGYDSCLDALRSAVDSLNTIRYENLVKEDCAYQQTLAKFKAAKGEVLQLKAEIAIGDSTVSLEADLAAKEEALDAIIALLEGFGDTANKSIDSAIAIVNKAIEALETYRESLPNQADVEKQLTIKAKSLDSKLNETKTKAFDDFEAKYSTDIQKAKDNVAAYKEQLKKNIAAEA